MEKVWFKLRQTDYPPPPEETILAGNGDDSIAPICLGHFISDLSRLDFPLNSGSILPFPARMRVYHAHTLNFKWDDSKAKAPGINLAAGAPILAAAGITVKATLQVAFGRTTECHEAYDRLDTYIVHPTPRYVEECLAHDKLKAYVKGKASWSLFMITGIKVARAGKREVHEGRGVVTNIGPEVDFPHIATATATTNILRESSQHVGGEHPGEFVWAVRLAKIHKGLLMRDWSVQPFNKGATFAAGDWDEVDVENLLQDEGLEGFKVIDDEELDEALVLDASMAHEFAHSK